MYTSKAGPIVLSTYFFSVIFGICSIIAVLLKMNIIVGISFILIVTIILTIVFYKFVSKSIYK